jgi:hypothetical protein
MSSTTSISICAHALFNSKWVSISIKSASIWASRKALSTELDSKHVDEAMTVITTSSSRMNFSQMSCGLAAQERWMKRKRVIKQNKHLNYIHELICIITALEVSIRDSAKSRQLTADELGDYFGLPQMTMLRALHWLDYRNVKLTFKLCLTTPMRFRRHVFAVQHLKWT